MKTEKSKDNRLVFITELVWKNWQVLLYAFDREGKTLSFPSFLRGGGEGGAAVGCGDVLEGKSGTGASDRPY